MSDNHWDNKLSKGIREIFELTKKLGGTISGEHGIGYVQKQYLDIVFSVFSSCLRFSTKSSTAVVIKSLFR